MSLSSGQTEHDQLREAVLRIEDKREQIGWLLSEIANEHDLIDNILDSLTPPF